MPKTPGNITTMDPTRRTTETTAAASPATPITTWVETLRLLPLLLLLLTLTASVAGSFSNPAGSPSRTADKIAGVLPHLLDPLNRGVHAIDDGEGSIGTTHFVPGERVGDKLSVDVLEVNDVTIFSYVV
jgi:hypothetical protein